MDEDDISVRPLPAHTTRGCYYVTILFNVLIAFGFGFGIVLILNLLNRSGWFALLSGLFGAMLFMALTLPRILFGSQWGQPRRPHPVADNADMPNGEVDDARSRRELQRGMFNGIIFYGGIGLVAFFGISFLPANQPIFAFFSAILGIVVCVALFAVALCVLLLVISFNRHTRVHAAEHHFDL